MPIIFTGMPIITTTIMALAKPHKIVGAVPTVTTRGTGPHPRAGELWQGLRIGITLNTVPVVAERVYGYLGNSTTLMADADYNLGDVFGLLVAWAASIAPKRAPSGRFTSGRRGSLILAAFANAVVLLVTSGGRLGVHTTLEGSGADHRRHHDGCCGGRDIDERRDGTALRKRSQGRPQRSRRVPAHGRDAAVSAVLIL